MESPCPPPLDRRPVTRFAHTAPGFASGAFGPFRSGSSMFDRKPSLRLRTVNHWPWPRVPTRSRTRSSSMQSQPGMPNETRRNLDGRGWRGLCRQTTSGGHRAGRPIRRQRFDRRLPIDYRSDPGTDLQTSHPAEHPEWTASAMPNDGGQGDGCAEETPRKAGRIAGCRRSQGAQSSHLRLLGSIRNGSEVACPTC